MKNIKLLFSSLVPAAMLLFSLATQAQTSDSFHFQGEVLDLNDDPILSSNVQLKFSIFDPSGTCLLYEEIRTFDLSVTNGSVSTPVGSSIGAAVRTGSDPGLSMNALLKNGGLVRGVTGTCPSGYTAAATDSRKLQVMIYTIDAVSINQALSMLNIYAAPTAMLAATAISLDPVADINMNNFRITNLVSPASSTDAVNKTYADTNLKGIAISGSPVANDVLKYDGSNWTPVPLAGGGTVTSVTGTAPIAVATGTTTPVISMPQATGGTNGYLSSTDWTTFNNKLSNSLASGMIWVGNAGVASPIGMNGDATLNSAGTLTLNTVQTNKGGTGTTTFGANKIVGTNGTGTVLQDFTCSVNQVISFDGGGNALCQNVSTLLGATPILQNGNSLATNMQIGTNDAFSFQIKTNSTAQLTVSPSGFLGVKTASPSSELEVNGAFTLQGIAAPSVSTAGQARIYFDNTSNKLRASENGGGYADLVTKWQLTGADMFTNSNVGIGITTPTEQLHIESPSSSMNGVKIRNTGGGSTAAPGIKLESAGGMTTMIYQGGSGSTYPGGVNAGGIGSTTSSPFVLVTNGLERIKIDPSGNIGIGTSAPNAKLHIQNGSIVGAIVTVPSGGTADVGLGNTAVFQSVGGSSIILNNLQIGGKYTVIIEDATSRTYTFSGCPGTTRFSPTNGLTTGGYHTIYELFSTGTNCYIKWSSGL